MKPICGTTVARKKARAGKEDKVRKENTTYLYLCLSYFQCLRNFWSLCAVFLTHTTCDWFFVFLVGLGMSFPMKRWFLVYLGKPYYSCTMTEWINILSFYCFVKSFQKFNFRGLWLGRESSKSLWSCGTQVLGTLHSYQFPCNDSFRFIFHSVYIEVAYSFFYELKPWCFGSWKIMKKNLKKWRTWPDRSMLLI